MPDNTIGGPASATLQQLEVSRQREREQAQNETNNNTAQVQPQQNASVDVEVELSQEARELSLSTVQQLGAPTQTAETQAAQTENPGQTLEEDNEREDTRPPPRENESQVTRQFDRSANESLGTVIDIRS